MLLASGLLQLIESRHQQLRQPPIPLVDAYIDSTIVRDARFCAKAFLFLMYSSIVLSICWRRDIKLGQCGTAWALERDITSHVSPLGCRRRASIVLARHSSRSLLQHFLWELATLSLHPALLLTFRWSHRAASPLHHAHISSFKMDFLS